MRAAHGSSRLTPVAACWCWVRPLRVHMAAETATSTSVWITADYRRVPLMSLLLYAALAGVPILLGECVSGFTLISMVM